MVNVVYSAPQAEFKAAARLERLGYKAFVPLGRSKRRPEPRPLFPRYLFAWITGPWRQAESSGWITYILRDGDDLASLPQAAIDEIKYRMDRDGGSVVTDSELERRFIANQPIRIQSGPYADLDAVYKAREGDRIIILLNMFQRPHTVTVDQRMVA